MLVRVEAGGPLTQRSKPACAEAIERLQSSF
jgi:hypothetical protein